MIIPHLTYCNCAVIRNTREVCRRDLREAEMCCPKKTKRAELFCDSISQTIYNVLLLGKAFSQSMARFTLLFDRYINHLRNHKLNFASTLFYLDNL